MPRSSNGSRVSRGSRGSGNKGIAEGTEGVRPTVVSTGPPELATESAEVTRDDLDELESRLTNNVDEDFFQDPSKFHTLHRVIDVLGAQLSDTTNAKYQSDYENLRRNNPAYKALKQQQQVVDGTIEHMAVVHCAELNGSVVQV